MAEKDLTEINGNLEEHKKISSRTKREGKEAWFVGQLLFILYRFCGGQFRNFIAKILFKLEGGGLYSLTLRRIASVYHQVDIGMYSGGIVQALSGGFRPGTKIGRYCSIVPTAIAFSANHPMNTLSTHAVFYNPALGFAQQDLLSRTNLTIGNDVFIGHNAIITSFVDSIGDGAVIGAGAVVGIHEHQNIPPYAVVVGNPARIVRYRFSKELILKLLQMKWWEKSVEELLPDFDNFRRPVENEEKIR